MSERISDRQLPNIRNMLKTAALHNSGHINDEFYQKLSEDVLKEFDEWVELVRKESVIEFVREQNVEYRKTLGKIMYAAIDEV